MDEVPTGGGFGFVCDLLPIICFTEAIALGGGGSIIVQYWLCLHKSFYVCRRSGQRTKIHNTRLNRFQSYQSVISHIREVLKSILKQTQHFNGSQDV